MLLRSEGGSPTKVEMLMNWNQIEGRWDQLAGQLKSQWGKLTDDDLKNIAGKRQQLVGKLQERYGVLKEDIERQVNEWLSKVGSHADDKAAPPSPTRDEPRPAQAGSPAESIKTADQPPS